MRNNETKNMNIIDKLGDMKYMKEFFNILKNKRVSILDKLLILTLTSITFIYIISPLDILTGWLTEAGYIKDLIVGAAMFTFIGSIIKKSISKANTKSKLSEPGESKIIEFRFQNHHTNTGSHNNTN